MFNFKGSFYIDFIRKYRGLLFLFFILFAIQIVAYVNFKRSPEYTYSTNDSIQRQIDSLYSIQENKKRTPIIYPFNPNYLTDEKGYRLGLSVKEIDNLFAYRKKGLFINSAKEFKQVTNISDSLFVVLKPYLKFPKWVTEKQTKKKYTPKKTSIVKKDINKATLPELKKVYGIGDVFANRIITYREKIKGFHDATQLFEIYGIDSAKVKEIKKRFKIIPPTIKKISLEESALEELMNIPYIDYDLAKAIILLRTQKGSISLDLIVTELALDSTLIKRLNYYVY